MDRCTQRIAVYGLGLKDALVDTLWAVSLSLPVHD